MRNTRWLSVLLVLVLVFSLCTSALAADPNPADDEGGRLLDSLPGSQSKALMDPSAAQYQPDDLVRVIVLTKSQPTAENSNLFQRVLNTNGKLLREHNAVKTKMEKQQVEFKVNFEYTALLNGMSMTVKYADLETIASLPGVTQVIIAREYRLPEDSPKAMSASEMINVGTLNSLTDADGSGKVIAVLDTGITAGHEAFGVYDGMLQTPAWEKVDMIKAIADVGHGAYYSQKVPYMYDYADGDNDAKDDGSGHGSHVSGIAAGYVVNDEGVVTFHGSAPDAQILAMKIFGSTEKTTSSDIYFAALEDAFKLGADVINMSIGAPNGFVEDAESVLNDQIYTRLENAGVICCISAGNEASMGEYSQNWWNQYVGQQAVMPDYADYGVLGSPASYNGNVAVAAVENTQYPAYMITVGEESFPYRDHNGTEFLDTFSGQDLECVMVPDLGVAEAYENIDVQGKVAVISRGEITFAEKVAYASAAGAIAAVVYDNTTGALVTMAIDNHTIPAVFVPQDAGAALAALEKPVLHVDSEPTVVDNPEAYGMASFSSWGPTNDLQIKPTLTGVGGNVNSVLAGTQNSYEVESGTSMSAPNVSGGYAALLEAICNANPDLSKAEAAALARNRTLSHALVLPEYWDQTEDGEYFPVPASPRRQGAGLLDVASAYQAVLAIADPLAELGDDPAKSGVFTITADLENTGDAEQTYAVYADVLTDSITGGNFGTADEPDIHLYNALSAALMEEGVDYTIDAPETVTLAAGEKKTVTVTITLTDEMKAEYLDAYFANGAFIEGYVYFESEAEQAHVTFMGFYGDWAAGSILEQHDWRDLLAVEIDPEYSENPMDYVDWEIDTVPTMAYLVDGEYNPKLYAGDAPFGYPEGGVFSESRIAVSNNLEEAYFTNLLVVPTIIRNARHIVMIARNAETGDIYYVDDTPYCQKTIYDAEEGSFSTYAWFLFDGMDYYSSEEGTPVADDTPVVLEFYANLPYGEDVLGSMTPEEIVADAADYLCYTVPVTVDGAAPVIEDYTYDPETGDVTVTVTDNQYLAAIYALDEEGNDLSETLLFADEKAGESHTVTLNVGEQETFYLAALDYATNESYVLVAGPHDHDWSDWEVVTEPTCEDEGEQVRTCQICGEEESEAIDALGHSLKEVAEVPADCENDGAKAHWVCETCGKLFADAEGKTEIEAPEVIPAGHTLKAVAEVPADCENAGVKEYWECEVCGKLFADAEGKTEIAKPEAIDALGHDLTAVAEVPADCEHDGVKAYWKCETCGKLFADAEGKTEIAKPEVIAALGHDLTAVAEVPATCEADGVKAYWKCETCGKLFSDAEGKTEIAKPEVLEKLGHDWDDGVITKQPSIAFEGEKLYTCKNDPSHTRTEVLEKLYDCDGGDNCPSKDFTDVDHSANSWSHEPIDWAVLKEITNGTSKTTFSPKKVCTRAEAVTFLWRAAGCPKPADADAPFADVTLDSWYAEAVLWAVEQGITNGTSATTFSPDDTCTRAQIVTFLWRMEQQPEAKEASSFDDVPAAAYYAKAIDWAVEQGITKGVDPTHFAPKADCTRAHIVTFLFRQFGK